MFVTYDTVRARFSSANLSKPTGLCYWENTYYRNWCTDPTWKSPNCLANVCTDDVSLRTAISKYHLTGFSRQSLQKSSNVQTEPGVVRLDVAQQQRLQEPQLLPR